MNILLLEDETDIAEPVVEALEDDRYDVVWVRDASHALAAVADREFDLCSSTSASPKVRTPASSSSATCATQGTAVP